MDREADLLDRDVRPFAEECDSMQGFQIFAGSDDAWGGWTSRYVDVLRDEYGKKSTWVYGLEDNKPIGREKMLVKKANTARTLSEVSKLGCVYSMLGTRPVQQTPAYFDCDLSSEWESTAIMAAAVESATLPIRLRDTVRSTQRSTMPQYEQFLSSDEGRQIWELGLTLDQETEAIRVNGAGDPSENSNFDPRAPQRIVNGTPNTQSTEDVPIDIEPKHPDIIFTPSTSHLLPTTPSNRSRSHGNPSTSQHINQHTFTQLLTSRSQNPSTNQTQQLTTELLLRLRYADQPLIQTYSIPLAFPLLDAYPSQLFPPPLTTASSSTLPARSSHSHVNLTASLTTSTSMRRTLVDLRDLVTRQSRVIGVDEREDLYNEITGMAERYTWGSEGDGFGGDDEDDDEDE